MSNLWEKRLVIQIHETEISDENRSDTDFTMKNA